MDCVLALDPYALRRRAINEKLEPFEIGRVLLHLNQRRGFLSNARKDKADKEVKGMLHEINELAGAMGERTLGQHLAELHDDPHVRLRGKHTRRQMLLNEFDRIWKAQSAHHPNLLTDALRYGNAGPQSHPFTLRRLPRKSDHLTEFGIEGIIFFQRPLYWPKSMIGICELEPRERRCPRADRAAQRFRLLQEVNNLRIIDPDRHQERQLSPDERTLLLEKLSVKEKLTFDDVRKHLGFLESVKFNLERGERGSLGGMKTDALLAKAFKGWHKLDNLTKDAVVRLLIDPAIDEPTARQRLLESHEFDAAAEALLSVELPAGYANLSLKAINKLLPFLERGMRYMAESNPELSALHAAGYLRPDELKRRLFDKLPPIAFIRSGPMADLPNPVVAAALYEVRKVVNAILREYGKPDAIHVELAREIKMSAAKRQEYNSRTRQREADRDAAADYLREKQVRLSRDNIIRYMLWKEQNESCVYTGNAIRFEHLFGGEVDIDHILPYSRTLDDSQMNKVVCFRAANAEKNQRTPFEWLAATEPDRYEQVCQRARRLAYPKYRNFSLKELELDDFIARQLRDTAYIARLAVEYLKMLLEKDHQVLGLKGQHTAELRHHWGLETVLSELPDSPAWAEDQAGHIRPGEKNRADHRHHAIDAIVVALTGRSRLQHLARIRRDGGSRVTGEILAEPWSGFRREVVQRVDAIRVSHRVRRKVSGPLHEDTIYGPTEKPGIFVVRKPVQSLSPNEVELIRDPGIRRIVAAAFAGAEIQTGRCKKGGEKSATTGETIKAALAKLCMKTKDGRSIPIRRVRVLRKEKTIRVIREGSGFDAYVKPGSTHHLCIFEWEENGRRVRHAEFVPMIEAARRIRDGEPIIQRTYPARPDARFVMSLSSGEMLLASWKGREKLMTFRTAASTQGQIYFAGHTDARRSADYQKLVCNCNTIEGRKVTVDPLGRIRWAND
jgi:CRISPR-associated endonuclease Csn1